MICEHNKIFLDVPFDCSAWRHAVPTISKVGALGDAYYIFGTLNTLAVFHAAPVHIVLGMDVERHCSAPVTLVLRCLVAVSVIAFVALAWVGVSTSPRLHAHISIIFAIAIIGHTLLVWRLQSRAALERLRCSICSTSVRGAPAECRLLLRSVGAALPTEQCKVAIVCAYVVLGVAMALSAAASLRQPYPSTFLTQVGPVGEWIAATLAALSQAGHAREVSLLGRRPHASPPASSRVHSQHTTD